MIFTKYCIICESPLVHTFTDFPSIIVLMSPWKQKFKDSHPQEAIIFVMPEFMILSLMLNTMGLYNFDR